MAYLWDLCSQKPLYSLSCFDLRFWILAAWKRAIPPFWWFEHNAMNWSIMSFFVKFIRSCLVGPLAVLLSQKMATYLHSLFFLEWIASVVFFVSYFWAHSFFLIVGTPLVLLFDVSLSSTHMVSCASSWAVQPIYRALGWQLSGRVKWKIRFGKVLASDSQLYEISLTIDSRRCTWTLSNWAKS